MQNLDIALIGMLAVRDGLIHEMPKNNEEIQEDKEKNQNTDIIPPEAYAELKAHIQDIVRQQFSLEDTARSRDPVVRSKFKTIAVNSMRNLSIQVNEPDIPVLVQRLFDDILGYAVLEKYFFDPAVTEIILNGIEIRVVKNGERMLANEKFENISQARQILERMLAPTGRKLDNATPEVNARLFDGSRLYAAIEPVAVDGVTASIRRFPETISPELMLANGTMSRELLEFLRACIVSRQNIVITGGTGSGKTTMINALGSFIPHDESIVTVEDTAELQIQHPDVRRLQARPANSEGEGEITLRDLIASTLRMRPDRIIVGECRKGEAFDMLQGMNTGHQGSLTTLHANSAESSISRLVGMVQQANMELSESAIYNQIASAVDIIMHIEANKMGQRRVDHIVEVVGPMRSELGEICGVELNPLWVYNAETDKWEWVAKQFFREDKLITKGGWKCLL